MKRILQLTLITTILALVSSGHAADSIRIKLADGKFKVAEGTPPELVTYDENEGRAAFYTAGTGEWTFELADDGAFTIRVSASCDPAQSKFGKFKLTIDGKEVGKEVELTGESSKDYELEAKLGPGEHKLAITSTLDLYKEGEYDMNLYIHGITLVAAPKK